jgi:hypothetical protein
MKILSLLNKSLGVYTFKGIQVEPTYWMAGTIVILIFMLLFTLARLRYLYVHWNLGKSSISMIFWGFILAMVIEGFLIISGKSLLTLVFGWESAPKPISTVLDVGRSRLINVLGAQDEDTNINPSAKLILEYQQLSTEEATVIKSFVCEP